MSVAEYIIGMVQKLQEPLNLTGWQLPLQHGPLEDAKAACEAEPEYKRAFLSFDLEKLQTGDELDEIIVHEMSHCHTWPLWDAAEDAQRLAISLAPEAMKAPMNELLTETIRRAGEDATTQVGFVYIKLLRRLWAAEAEVKKLKEKLKKVDKVGAAG